MGQHHETNRENRNASVGLMAIKRQPEMLTEADKNSILQEMRSNFTYYVNRILYLGKHIHLGSNLD